MPKKTPTIKIGMIGLTRQQKRKAKQDLAVYREFKQITSQPEGTIAGAQEYLMEKYAIGSHKTVNNIVKRVEAQLATKETQAATA